MNTCSNEQLIHLNTCSNEQLIHLNTRSNVHLTHARDNSNIYLLEHSLNYLQPISSYYIHSTSHRLAPLHHKNHTHPIKIKCSTYPNLFLLKPKSPPFYQTIHLLTICLHLLHTLLTTSSYTITIRKR